MRAASPLRISALGFAGREAPEGRALQDFARSLIVSRTGVECEWPVPPPDWSLSRLLTEAVATGSLPHVLAVGNLLQEPACRQFILTAGIAREITADLVRKNMPAYSARIKTYGRTVEDVLARNRCEGKNLGVPIGFALGEFPSLTDHPGAKRLSGGTYYALEFRDDILKQVFPGARTEAELQDLLVRKGSLSVDDIIGDMPIGDLQGLQRYLARVKTLGLQAGGAPLVPGSLIASFERSDSLYWSLCTATGYFWDIPCTRGDPPEWDKTNHFWFRPEAKEYLRWWNRLYREGLVDHDMFSLTDEQLLAREKEGRYAVVNSWFWADAVRRAAGSRRYGYRYFPVFFGRWKDLWGNYALAAGCQETPLVFTRRIASADELRRVMHWADWFMSEERDLLAYWGLPDWYAGTGAHRRYTWEHHALEDWAVYGLESERDGARLGLEHTPAIEWEPASVKLPLGPISFFADACAYPDAPFYVYPKDARRLLRSINLRQYCQDVITAARYDECSLRYVGDWQQEAILRLPEVAAFYASFWERIAEWRALVQAAISCPAERFDGAYRDFLALYPDLGGGPCRRAAVSYMKDIYPTEIEPHIFLDRRERDASANKESPDPSAVRGPPRERR